MKVKAMLVLCFINAVNFLFLIQGGGNNDWSVALIATAIVTLMVAPFVYLYCRSSEKHISRFMVVPTWANAFRALFPPRTKKSKN